MGPFLEMTRFWAQTALMLLLASCGSDKSAPALPIKAIFQAQLDKLKGAGAPPVAGAAIEPDAATLAEGRRVLQEGGQPVMAVTDRSLGLATFMVPLGQNAGVVTWANPEYQTLALRDGVILATRGFGNDLMSAEAPTAQQLRQGSGSTRRVHYVLDGADQTQTQIYTCQLSVSNNETIAVLGLTYISEKVLEVCEGAAGGFTNLYWFDKSGIIRQSQQVREPGVEKMQLQMIID